MSVLKIWTVSLAISFIVGCSSGQSADPPAPPAPPAKTVFDPLTQNLGKARDVQKTMDANADSTRKAVDKQERGEEAP
jgi:hypothetical protein